MLRLSVTLLAIIGLVVGCTTPSSSPTADNHKEMVPSLTIVAPTGNIEVAEPFTIGISVAGATPDAELHIQVLGIGTITPSYPVLVIRADRLGNAFVQGTVTISTAGHVGLVATADVGGTPISDAIDIVFDVPGSRLAAQTVGATSAVGRTITAEEFYATIPLTSDSNYVVQFERARAGLSPASNDPTTDLPTTILVDDIQYMLPGGDLSEPVSAIEYFLPDTGGGQPLPGEVEGAIDEQSSVQLVSQANCGSMSTYLYFRQTIDGKSQLMPKGTYVRAVDYNGILPDYILAEGFIDANGKFAYDLPNCDTSTIFDYSQPDVYYILETRTNDGLTALPRDLRQTSLVAHRDLLQSDSRQHQRQDPQHRR